MPYFITESCESIQTGMPIHCSQQNVSIKTDIIVVPSLGGGVRMLVVFLPF